MYESDNKNVNPNHYKQGGMETIDVIEAFTKDLNGVDAFCAGNAIKYTLRFSHKNGIEDIEKAIWYLTYLKEHYKPEQQPKIISTYDHIPDPKEIEKDIMNGLCSILGSNMVNAKNWDPNAIVVAAPDENLNADKVYRDKPEKENINEDLYFSGRYNDKGRRVSHTRRNKRKRSKARVTKHGITWQ